MAADGRDQGHGEKTSLWGSLEIFAERDLLKALRNDGIRIDGRATHACRRVGIRFGAAHGEVEVSLGPTRAMAVCSGEIVTPSPERPNEGRVAFHVEYGPMASPNFEVGRPSPAANATAAFIERLLRGSHAIDQEALCIVGGQKVWSIRVDVRAMDDDGNLGDACALAALCSLMHFRKLDVEVQGEQAKVFKSEERVPVPLSIHHVPVPVTFALFPPRERRSEPSWVLDPTRLEESVMAGVLTIAVNQHGELCALHKPGGVPVAFGLLEQCAALAVARAKELCVKLKEALDADLERRRAARRNVHRVAPARPAAPDVATQLQTVRAEAAELEAQLAAQEAAADDEDMGAAAEAAATAVAGGTSAADAADGATPTPRKKKKRRKMAGNAAAAVPVVEC